MGGDLSNGVVCDMGNYVTWKFSFVILILVAASKLGCECSVQRSEDSLNGIQGSLLVPQTCLRRFDGLAGLPSRLGYLDVFAGGFGCPHASPMGWPAFAESFGWSCRLSC